VRCRTLCRGGESVPRMMLFSREQIPAGKWAVAGSFDTEPDIAAITVQYRIAGCCPA